MRHLQPFLDEIFVAAVIQLFRRLVAVVLFAYLFSLLLRGRLRAAHSYIFWLDREALTLVSTATPICSPFGSFPRRCCGFKSY